MNKIIDFSIAEARGFALDHHAQDMYGVHPYIYHLDQVHDMTAELGFPIEEQIAAYLHDIVEDHDVTKEELKAKFGEIVADLVWAVTGIGKNRRERRDDTIAKLTAYPRAIKLKMCDRYLNIKNALDSRKWSLIKMYMSEMPYYRYLFATHEPELWQRMLVLIEEVASHDKT